MPTLSSKEYRGLDNKMTDGTDNTKCKAIYDAICTDSAIRTVKIEKTIHVAGNDTNINNAIQGELDAGHY